MNRKRILPVLVAVLLVAGCASIPPQRIALNTMQSIRAAVEESLKVFNAGYQAGQFSDAQRAQLGGLYQKYLDADRIAGEALLAASSGTDYTAMVARVTVVAGDVIKFVNTLKGGP